MAQPSAGRLHALTRVKSVCHRWCSGTWQGSVQGLQQLSGCPLCTLAWLHRACVRGQRWISDCITGWELSDELWMCVLSCCSFCGLWQRKWGGRFRKFGSLPGTMLRERGQSRQELLENIEVVFWVCVFTVQVEIT